MAGSLRAAVVALGIALVISIGASGQSPQNGAPGGARPASSGQGDQQSGDPQTPAPPSSGQPASGQPADGRQSGQPASGQPSNGQQPTPDAQQPPTDPQQPTFRAGVNFVRVDVIVNDRSGKPVDDLKPEDFEVTEDGKPQQIETFKLISLDGGLMAEPGTNTVIRTDFDEEREAARDDVRLFAMFLDDYHVKKDSSIAMRQQLARFVETQLGPSDMLGLMSPLQPLASVRFGRNHDVSQRALLQFEGRKYDYCPKNAAEERYAYSATPEQMEQIRNQVSFTAIKALIMQMGSLKEGRKALILVSEGYSNTVPASLARATCGAQSQIDAGDPGGGLGPNTMQTSYEFFRSMDLNLDMQLVYDLANRNNVSIYTVDPRGLAAQEFGVDLPSVDQRADSRMLNNTMDTLKSLADFTDGRAIVNRNDLAVAMKQIVVDSSAYYLLGYRSSLTEQDGKFHKIDVKVKRSGLSAPRHRNGYWAMKPEEASKVAAVVARASAPAPEPSSVEKAISTTLTPRGRVIRTWMGTERGADGKTKVTFVWEPMPPRAGDVVRPQDRPARVLVTAISPDGSSYFRGRVPDTGPANVMPASAQTTFEAPPGPMQLRLSVEGAESNVIDTETRELTIPDLGASAVVFGTPVLLRARSIPELQRLRTDMNALPSAVREFSKTDRLLVRAVAYGSGGTAPEITASVLNRAGQKVSDLPVTTIAPNTGQVELTLTNFNPGDYAVALNASGGGEAHEIVAFRVVP